MLILKSSLASLKEQTMSTDNSIEYSVYTFGGEKNGKRKPSWKKQMTSEDMHKAIQEAETLFNSDKYGRVEVKKKYFDPKNKRTVDMSIKTFEKEKKKEINVLTILIGGIIFAVIAFYLTYTLIGQG